MEKIITVLKIIHFEIIIAIKNVYFIIYYNQNFHRAIKNIYKKINKEMRINVVWSIFFVFNDR